MFVFNNSVLFNKNYFIFKAKIFIQYFLLSFRLADTQSYIRVKGLLLWRLRGRKWLSSIDNLLMETEIQDSNPELGFHEAALLLNRLEMAVSVLRGFVEMDLDLDRNVDQVLRQLFSSYICTSILGCKSEPKKTQN